VNLESRLLIVAVALVVASSTRAAPLFVEKDGLVIMEAESTTSRLGDWEKRTDVDGYTGSCHLEFTGNKPMSGSPKSPLEYRFRTGRAGDYTLTIRARKRLGNEEPDKCNDGYVRIEGDFDRGGEKTAPLAELKKNNKFFGGNADGWGWATRLDIHHKKYPAVYRFKADQTYTFVLHGRSQRWNVDRIVLYHEDVKRAEATDPKKDETVGSGGPRKATRGVAGKPPLRKLTPRRGRLTRPGS
jgi:hypothetical protein